MRLSVAAVLVASLVACNSDRDRSVGQTHFESAPPNSSSFVQGAVDGASDGSGSAPPGAMGAPPTTRKVEETDLYRLDGNRLYYLNTYRGLMVFNVTNPDQPRLLGRSPIFGNPIDMIVRNGVAIVVIGDWFGRMDDGTPFHGSIVRGLDATDPSNIRVLGEAKLGGWVRDDRVVGDVIYAVSEDYGWEYGWPGTVTPDAASSGASPDIINPSRESVIVSSVSFANNTITQVGSVRYGGFTGVFNVTPDSILLASAGTATGQTELKYLDISDPGGAIVPRGTLAVEGTVNGWGADYGRWNLDFADGKTAHMIGQDYGYSGGYTLSTVDFSNPDAPVLDSAMSIARAGWDAAARFDGDRLYLSPESGYYDGSGTTPFQVYDLTDRVAPRLAGTVTVSGDVWNILPAPGSAPGSRIFALGHDRASAGYGDAVSLQYLDVTDPAAPRLLGTSKFGQGWAWTPAAGTFKAFTMDATKGLVVLPFGSWDSRSNSYTNGLQLIEFSPTTVTTAGPARTRGWVERGIFVGNRLLSLSDLALAVVDYTDPMQPSVVTELTLARNVITARPNGATVTEISSDWWDNDTTSSQVRVLPIENAEENADTNLAVPTVDVDGINARVFTNGATSYIVTDVRTNTSCPGTDSVVCNGRAQQVQVVDLVNGAPVLRGKIQLPDDRWGYGWGWYGFRWSDWWFGDEVVQVGSDTLAFRRWQPVYDRNGNYLDANSKLYIVDLANPDAPRIASTVIQTDAQAWWGNLRVVGTTLYTTHYEWVDNPKDNQGWVKYYLDSIDLADRANPRIGAKVNVPGLLVGGDASDPSIVYTIDYRWDGGDYPVNDLDVLRIHSAQATLLSHTTIDGWVGSTFVRGTTAYLSSQQWSDTDNRFELTRVDLHAIDLGNPDHPRDRVTSDSGWGWLLAVEGDRALVTSGWGDDQSIDVYQLHDGRAPTFDQTIRTRGWWFNGISRQDQTLFLSSGYWGVQKVQLQ
jgi:hypothetical protein